MGAPPHARAVTRQPTAKNRSRCRLQAARGNEWGVRDAPAPSVAGAGAEASRSGRHKWSAGSSTQACSGGPGLATSVRTSSRISSELGRHPVSTGTTLVKLEAAVQVCARACALGSSAPQGGRARGGAHRLGLDQVECASDGGADGGRVRWTASPPQLRRRGSARAAQPVTSSGFNVMRMMLTKSGHKQTVHEHVLS